MSDTRQGITLGRAVASPPVKAHGPAGSSNSSLHAKTFSVERSRVFIGSFNFDPRSARLNEDLASEFGSILQ